MSDLRPRGIAVNIDGVERHLLFTLNAIDAVQDKFKKTLFEVLEEITKEVVPDHKIRDVLYILINDEVEREHHRDTDSELTKITEQELGWIIGTDNYMELVGIVLMAYNESMPKQEENDPNRESGQTNS